MKRTGLIIMIAVLALGALGIGYSAWSQTLTLKGNVSSGTFIVDIPTGNATGAPALASNTSATYFALSGQSSSGFTVDVSNGYPGLTGTINYTVENTGSIPASVTSYQVSVDGGNTFNTYTDGNPQTLDLTSTSDNTWPITVTNSGLGTAISPGGSNACTLTITFPDTTDYNLQTHSGTFQFNIAASQAPGS